ncbi:hypothetical protein AVEN_57121-1 [Araneus ventricosus]|uniref:HTH psq-type domain-containing protein n=1 Tax=Araneus ventricosus TaxID=182803 RepID=A0A4Y2H6E5_ARAVE|nr:hypothetical protein AVEN_57121-1 [Araneus ventricosus]
MGTLPQVAMEGAVDWRPGLMPRTKKRYKCKNKRHQSDKSQMVRAIAAVKAKEASVKGAARRFEVPRSTLQRFYKT